jgi:hypothetical protein
MSYFSGMLHLQPSFFNALCSALGLRTFLGDHFQPVSPLQRCAWAHSMLGAGHLPLGPENADVERDHVSDEAQHHDTMDCHKEVSPERVYGAVGVLAEWQWQALPHASSAVE